ncbi:hypothetical protein GmHk_11G033014 [Glycine max]|nr:hypothetical protein GmHk_11G033014 [Glycine max]
MLRDKAGVHSVISLILAFILDRAAHHHSALKGLDDTQQSKSKPPVRLICTERCISKFHNAFSVIDKKEALSYFTDSRPLESERLNALRNQWTKYYLKVKNETYNV